MNNPKLQDCKISHIHSHNVMLTFFSTTDCQELYDNSEFHNYYLSLIVNNRGDMCARVAFRETIESHVTSTISVRDIDGNLKKDRIDTKTINSFKVMFYECEVIRDIIEDSILKTRIEVLLEDKKQKELAKRKLIAQQIPQPYKNGVNLGGIKPTKQGNIFDDWDTTKFKPLVTPSKIGDAIESIKVNQFLITWLNQDFLANKELNRTLAALHTQIDTPNFEFYLEYLNSTIDDYYMNIFIEDLHLVLFEKVMDKCVEILKLYVKDYEELITELMMILETGSNEDAFLGTALSEEQQELILNDYL